MMDGNLERWLPSEWAENYEPLALLKDGEERQTLLLRERDGKSGRLAVMKRAAGDGRHLQNEYELLKALAGPGVPVVYALLERGEESFLLREYVEGETLLDFMQKHPKLSAREAARIGVEICRVLRRLHEQEPPVVHRDIKAENIIRRGDGSCALIDFGIARRQRGEARRDTEPLGTPSVAPPEQFGLQQTAPSADVYALGVLLRELSTGELGLERGNPPAALRRVIRHCTAVDPAKRYRDAAELERALQSVAKPRALPWAACACLAIAAALAWHFLPVRAAAPEPSEPYAFASPAIEAEVCRQLGLEPGNVTRGDLADVRQLLLVGEIPFDNWDSLTAYGEEVQLDGRAVRSAGGIDTLADIPNLPNLRELALCRQEIDDLTPLRGCELHRLALCGNEIGDLSPLGDCSQLRELLISDNPVADLSPISACGLLWKINLGATEVANLDALGDMPALIYVESHDNWKLKDISALEKLDRLWHLSLRPVPDGFEEVIGRLTSLENLYLWYMEAEPELPRLSQLTRLKRLFVHAFKLCSLDGLESMQELNYLEIYADIPLNLTPLRSLENLTDLRAANMRPRGWTALATLPKLERVYCTPAQAEEIQNQLRGRSHRFALITPNEPSA